MRGHQCRARDTSPSQAFRICYQQSVRNFRPRLPGKLFKRIRTKKCHDRLFVHTSTHGAIPFWQRDRILSGTLCSLKPRIPVKTSKLSHSLLSVAIQFNENNGDRRPISKGQTTRFAQNGNQLMRQNAQR